MPSGEGGGGGDGAPPAAPSSPSSPSPLVPLVPPVPVPVLPPPEAVAVQWPHESSQLAATVALLHLRIFRAHHAADATSAHAGSLPPPPPPPPAPPPPAPPPPVASSPLGGEGGVGVPGGCMTRSRQLAYISALMASPPFQIQRSVAAPRHSVSAGICTSSVCRHLYVVMVKRSSGDGNVAAQERRGQPQALFGCRRRSTVWPAAAPPRRPL